jgi:hypothetical protein
MPHHPVARAVLVVRRHGTSALYALRAEAMVRRTHKEVEERTPMNKQLGLALVESLHEAGLPCNVSLRTARACVAGTVLCPQCSSSDIDPMASGLFCRGCSHYWRPAEGQQL